MTFILTNDDGIDAPGILALSQAVKEDFIVVAPQDHLSGCGHQVTTHTPIQVQVRSPKAYALKGTPADCTRFALRQLQPSYVLSGINAGGNLGVDVYISGTVAAVREAAIHGIPGIAISHWIKRPLIIDWQVATTWTVRVLDKLLSLPLPPKCFWNVNLPHLPPGAPEPEIVFCPPSSDPLPLDFRVEGDSFYYVGEYAKRSRTPGTDVDVCFSGKIAVVQLKV